MTSISAGGSVSVGYSGGGRVSGGASAWGQASTDVDALVALARMGSQVTEFVGAGASAAAGAAKDVKAFAGRAVGSAAGGVDRAADFLRGVAGSLPRIDAGEISGRMAAAFTPPRPDIKLAARAEVHARLETEHGVKNGGWPQQRATVTDVKADGSFEVKNGHVSAEQRAEIGGIIRLVMDAAVKGGSLVSAGIDLAGRCADNPLISSLLAALPKGLEVLGRARAAVGGGMQHLARFFMELVGKLTIHINVGGTGGSEAPATLRPGEPGAPPPAARDESDLSAVLNNPNLSFEDKIFLFCLSVAKRQEDKIEKMMKDWEGAKKAAQNPGAQKPGGKGGSEAPAAGGGGGGSGGIFPGGMGSTVGNIVGMAQNVGSGVLGVAGIAAPFVMEAMGTLCGALATAVPVAGPALGVAAKVLGNPITGMMVGGVLTAAAGALQQLPLASWAEKAVNGMSTGQGGAPAQSSAPAQTSTTGSTGGARSSGPNMKGAVAGAAIGSLVGAAAFGPTPLGAVSGVMGGIVGGVAGSGIMGDGPMPGAVLGALVGAAAGPPTGLIIAPVFAALGGMVSSTLGAQGQAPAGQGTGEAGHGGNTAPGGTGSHGGDTTVQLGDGTTVDAKGKDSEATFMQKLSHEQQQLSKMYEMLTNMMKASHDTQMSSIRNIK